MDFETQHHVVLFEILLSGDLHFLECAKEGLQGPVARLQESGALLKGR